MNQRERELRDKAYPALKAWSRDDTRAEIKSVLDRMETDWLLNTLFPKETNTEWLIELRDN